MKAEGYDIMMRSLDDELSEQQRRQLERLLSASFAARDELDQIKRVRAAVQQSGPGSFSPFFADRVMRRLAAERRPVRAHRAPVRMGLFAGIAAAAAVAFLALFIALWLQPHRLTAPHGDSLTAVLPDGSTVELSSGTRLQYDRTGRRVTLNGEAFFDVVGDERPFIVETFNAQVAVLGTQFNVRAWSESVGEETVVTLASGRVEVFSRLSPSEAIFLEPGESAQVLSDTLRPLSAVAYPLERMIAWRTGGLAFVDQPLVEVFRELERRFDVQITIADPTVASRRWTFFEPHPRSAGEVLYDMSHTLNLRYRRTGRGFEVTSAGF